MSTTTITFQVYQSGVLADPDAIVLSSPDATYGVKRTDTDAVVVADGTAMTHVSTGVYSYAVTDPAYDLVYEYAVEVTIGADVFHSLCTIEGTDTPPALPVGGITLAGMRLLLVQMTQRYDLVLDGDLVGNTDNGANYLINAGQRWLDRKVTSRLASSRRYQILTAGSYYLHFPGLMKPTRVIVATSDVRYDITRCVLQIDKIRELDNIDITEWESGTPSFWAQNITSLSSAHDGEDGTDFSSAGYSDYGDVSFSGIPQRSMLFYPKADVAYTIWVEGKFYSKTLTLDADTSFWTQENPDLLAMAAALIHERRIGSFTKASQLHAHIMEEISDLDSTDIHWESAGELGEYDPPYGGLSV